MSMVRCEECESLIDSDDDPECFEEVRYGMNYRLTATIARCVNCRPTEEAEMPDPVTPQDVALQRIVRSINFVLDELDELIATAADNDQPEVQTLVCAEQIKIGQCASRVQLLLSFIESRTAPKLKVIHGKA